MKIFCKYKLLQSAFICLFILIFTNLLFAGAWPEKKGGGYYKLSFRYLKSDKFYNFEGDKIVIPDFTDITIGFYGTYGLTDKLTLSLNASLYKYEKLKRDFTFDLAWPYGEVSGFGDMAVGMKYGFAEIGKTVFATSLKLGFPTGNTDYVAWTGRKDFSETISIEAGHSFYPSGFYLTELISLTNRNKGFSDEFRYLIEGGCNFGKGFTIIGRFHGLVSLKNGNEYVNTGYAIFMNNAQYFAYNIELVYKIIKNFGVSVYYESGGGGRNIISAPVLNAAIFYTL